MLPTKEEWIKALTERHGKELQQAFSSATVAICGLGGLGSNIAIHLDRAGIGRLILIDFDRVDITNLHRQQYKADQIGMYKTDALSENLREINPYIVLDAHTERITEDNAVKLLQSADPQLDIETIVLPCEKDDIDTVFAVKEAIRRGYKDFFLIGVIGARLDHTLGNVYVLEYLDELGLKGKIIDDYSEMELVSREPAYIEDLYAFFSLINITGIAKGITIENEPPQIVRTAQKRVL